MEAKHWGGLVYYTEWSRLLLKKRSCFFSFNYTLVRPRYYTGWSQRLWLMDLALVRPLYDSERFQWKSEILEPGLNSTHQQPGQAGHGMLTGRQQQQHLISKPGTRFLLSVN